MRFDGLLQGGLVLESGGRYATPIGVRWLEGINFWAQGASVAIVFFVIAYVLPSPAGAVPPRTFL